MNRIITSVLIGCCLASANVALAADEKSKKPAQAEAAKKAEVEKKKKAEKAAKEAATRKKAEAEKLARKKAAARKKAEAEKAKASAKRKASEKSKKVVAKKKESAKPRSRSKSYDEQRKAAYEKYIATRKALDGKLDKARDAHRKAQAVCRETERALAEVEAAIKRNADDWQRTETAYASGRARERAQREKNVKAEAAHRQRSENEALKRSVYEMKKELDSLRSQVAALRGQKSTASPAKKEKKSR